MKKVVKTIIPSILLGVYPVMFLYFNNVSEMSISEIIEPTILFVLSSIAVFLICCCLTRTLEWGGVLSFFLCLLGTNYLYIEEGITVIIKQAKFWHVFPVILFICIIVSNSLYKHLNDEGKSYFFKIATIVPLLLIMFNGILAVPDIIKSMSAEKITMYTELTTENGVEDLPNVYYFIFDEYSNFDVLQEYFNYDNLLFADYLEKNKFTVSYEGMNDSQQTATITANYANLDYVVFDSDNSERKNELRKKGYLFDLVRAHGYEIKTHGMNDAYFGLDGGETAASTMSGESVLTTMLRRTCFYPFIKNNAYTTASGFLEKIEEFHEKAMYRDNNMKFHFSYYSMPHQPFVFDENGGEVALAHLNDWQDPQYYLGQLKFVTKEIEKILTSILSNDPEAIIILQSDHSARSLQNEKGEYLIDKYDRRKFLNAVYFGGKPLNEIKGQSGVNTLRIVFGRLLNEDFPIVEVPISDAEF